MTGRLIGVVGPSGVGKDTVMRALANSVTGIALVRRVITREHGLGDEDFEAASEIEFERRRATGAFCVDWRAHGLQYGIPKDVQTRVAKGEELLVNLSRNVLGEVAAVFPRFLVLNITATRGTLTARLAARGRESSEDIEGRLDRVVRPLPSELSVADISNDGPLEVTIQRALAILHPVRA